MALMTMIARTIDGLPLVGTMQESEEVRDIDENLKFGFNQFNFHLNLAVG